MSVGTLLICEQVAEAVITPGFAGNCGETVGNLFPFSRLRLLDPVVKYQSQAN